MADSSGYQLETLWTEKHLLFDEVNMGLFSFVTDFFTVPDNKNPVPEPAELPTNKEGRLIGVLFGTREIKSANILWYGAVDPVPLYRSQGKKGG